LRCVTGSGTDSSGPDGMVMVLFGFRVVVVIDDLLRVGIKIVLQAMKDVARRARFRRRCAQSLGT
jgi:hypothetical protein